MALPLPCHIRDRNQGSFRFILNHSSTIEKRKSARYLYQDTISAFILILGNGRFHAMREWIASKYSGTFKMIAVKLFAPQKWENYHPGADSWDVSNWQTDFVSR